MPLKNDVRRETVVRNQPDFFPVAGHCVRPANFGHLIDVSTLKTVLILKTLVAYISSPPFVAILSWAKDEGKTKNAAERAAQDSA